MKKIILLIPFILIGVLTGAQNNFKALIKDGKTGEPLIGATAVLLGTTNGGSADGKGLTEINNVPDGKQIIVFSYAGYAQKTDTLTFPLQQDSPLVVLMDPSSTEIEEVEVSATRSSRTIDDIPTRVETITAGELDEKASMQPANVKMTLTESTGIQTQQTSATSANASIRIQGLDGKYTQILKDGFPLYSGFSSGLSIIQIPPLDLKRVELIKGSASTLYGGGAIAGLINFVSKVPAQKKELSFLVNGNNTKASDVSAFYSQRWKKTGITLFASQNTQQAYDPNKDGLSDIPKFIRYNFNPKIFYYIDSSATLSFGLNTSFENRLGGDMQVINHSADSVHTFFERNISNRGSTQLKFEKAFKNKSVLTFKNSVGYFDRTIRKPDYLFSGRQISSFSELNILIPNKRSEWIAGLTAWTDNFKQTNAAPLVLDNGSVIAGIFAQNSYKVSDKLIVEAGLRADGTSKNNFFVLPKLSVLYKITSKLTSRIGGGLGYKMPTIFSEEAEERDFQNIQPLNYSIIKPETSVGGSWDLNYRTMLSDELSLSINQLFFYTRLANPLILSADTLPNGRYAFVNALGYMDTKGFETNLKLAYDAIVFYCGYTFIDAWQRYDIKRINPLTAKSRLYITLMYEEEGKWRIGYELFYTGQQYLDDGSKTRDYWVMGVSAERMFKHFSVFVNAENFTDTRQTRFESIYNGTLQNPQFKQIWAPTDGFIFNAGFKLKVW